MAKHGIMPKSLVALAKQALAVAKRVLPLYSAKRSRHDFTQAQLFAILVLRQFFQPDYRGIVRLAASRPHRPAANPEAQQHPAFYNPSKSPAKASKKGAIKATFELIAK